MSTVFKRLISEEKMPIEPEDHQGQMEVLKKYPKRIARLIFNTKSLINRVFRIPPDVDYVSPIESEDHRVTALNDGGYIAEPGVFENGKTPYAPEVIASLKKSN